MTDRTSSETSVSQQRGSGHRASVHPVAIVTGSARGIGRGIAERLVSDGFHVVVNYLRSEHEAQQLADDLTARGPAAAIAVRADVARLEDHRVLIEAVINQWGRLDLLVNNAGISSPGRSDLLDATPENWDTVIGTNLRGPYFLAQLAARTMLSLLESRSITRGTIVNVSSISSYTISTNRGDYCVAKAGLQMATQLFAARLAPHNILVYDVSPGIIDSDMTAPVRERYDRMIADGLLPIARWGSPADVAAAVSVLARGELNYCTGQTLHIDGGFHIRRL
ncbi:MAG: 3-ketoacyl-ACP reductase [Pirellulales bacterium]